MAEAYLKDADDITSRHLIWSCTKQVMGILTGIAVDQEIISSIEDPISDYLPEVLTDYPEKSAITIEHLITMQSGNDYNNDGVGGETDKVLRQIPDNITEFVLSRPMINEPGTVFNYNDGDPQLMSAILQRATGSPQMPGPMKFYFRGSGSIITIGSGIKTELPWVDSELKPPPGKWQRSPCVWPTAAGQAGSKSYRPAGSLK